MKEYKLKYGDTIKYEDNYKKVYDKNNNKVYVQFDWGYFIKTEYDQDNYIVYVETSKGVLLDLRGENND